MGSISEHVFHHPSPKETSIQHNMVLVRRGEHDIAFYPSERSDFSNGDISGNNGRDLANAVYDAQVVSRSDIVDITIRDPHGNIVTERLMYGEARELTASVTSHVFLPAEPIANMQAIVHEENIVAWKRVGPVENLHEWVIKAQALNPQITTG